MQSLWSRDQKEQGLDSLGYAYAYKGGIKPTIKQVPISIKKKMKNCQKKKKNLVYGVWISFDIERNKFPAIVPKPLM